MEVLLGILFDFIPIMLILVLHFRNFRDKDIASNELRKRTVTQNNSFVKSEDRGPSQEVLILDYADLKKSNSNDISNDSETKMSSRHSLEGSKLLEE